MMCNRSFVLVLLTALWLPVQSVAAFAMPLVWLAGSKPVATAEVTAEAQMPCHQALGSQASEQSEKAGGAANGLGACSHCGVCQLVGAGYVPAAIVATRDEPASHLLVGVFLSLHDSQFPEPLDQPPRRFS